MSDYEWKSDDVFLVHELFSAAECDEYIAFAEKIGFEEAAINVGMGAQVVVKDVRNNDRVIVDDRSRSDELWKRAKPFVPDIINRAQALGCNERLRFYRYDPGQRFNWHFDGAFQRSNGQRSRITYMVYLNDDFEGGDTHFESFIIRPRKGTALFFTHQIRHMGAEVLRGRKYVLRTDLMYTF